MFRHTLPPHNGSRRPARTPGTLALLGAVLLNAAAFQPFALAQQPSPAGASAPAIEQSQRQTRLPREVRQRVRRDLAQQTNLPRRDLRVIAFSRETWPNGCLGLATAGEFCTMALVEGWRIELTNGQQNWIYRTDLEARVMRLEESPVEAGLPAGVRDRLLQTIAKDANLPVSQLQISEIQPDTFDGCMGIYAPGRFCTRIAIAGWRVIASTTSSTNSSTTPSQSWVYNISQDASRIVQNPTASGGQVVPSFIPSPGWADEMPGNNIVFRSIESGGLAGIVTYRELRSDGGLYQWSTRLGNAQGEPQLQKQLTPEQVQQFQQVLQTQRIPNLNGLRYITSEALADYPTLTLQGMGSTVEYIDLAEERLPRSLKTIVDAWNGLLK
ncbi:MAG: hypothetical protein MUF49_21880 [Oculatellaceae cyanobacterium Prado106]|nr:hypothetical protein [Oculatellaceae cyanobacterium Prado106]